MGLANESGLAHEYVIAVISEDFLPPLSRKTPIQTSA